LLKSPKRHRPLALLLLVTCSLLAAAQEAPHPAESAEIHVGKGYEALKNDRYEEAVTEFRAALAVDPKLVLRARFPLAVALFEWHKPAEARQELEAVRREAGDHPNISYYMGRIDLEDRDFAGAVKNLSAAAGNPPFPDTAYFLGYAYAKQGDTAQAENWFKKAAEATPRDSRVQYQLGMIYRKQGREEEAKQAFALSEDLHQHDDNAGRIRLECGQKLDRGLREEAHRVCNQLYDPDNADSLTELGTLYGGHGDPEAALNPLQRAAELSPQSPQMQYNLAYVYFQLNRFEKSRKILAEVLKRWPDLFQLNALYGAVLFRLEDDALAREALRHAQKLNPADPGTSEFLYATTLRLAAKSHAAQRYDDSLHYLEEAAQLRPTDPGPHELMAEVYKQMGRLERATSEQKLAQSLGAKP
jgi:tetratricopeptide (TPR) repeat protein